MVTMSQSLPLQVGHISVCQNATTCLSLDTAVPVFWNTPLIFVHDLLVKDSSGLGWKLISPCKPTDTFYYWHTILYLVNCSS